MKTTVKGEKTLLHIVVHSVQILLWWIWGMGRQDKAAPGRHWSALPPEVKCEEDYRDCLGWMGLDLGSLEETES